MKLPSEWACLSAYSVGNLKERLRSEKAPRTGFRTGVRFPSAPPTKVDNLNFAFKFSTFLFFWNGNRTGREWMTCRGHVRADPDRARRRERFPSAPPEKSTSSEVLFSMISVPCGHGWYTLRVWCRYRWWYMPSAYEGTDIISRQRYIIIKCLLVQSSNSWFSNKRLIIDLAVCVSYNKSNDLSIR